MNKKQTMRERIARRILKECFEQTCVQAPSWESCSLEGRESYLSLADGVLDEMREPDEGMIDAGNQALAGWVAPAMHSNEAYCAMIDHACREG